MPGGLHPPPEVVRSWPRPNYVDPETRGWDVIVWCTVFCALAALIVGLRLWARFRLLRSAGVDDYLIAVSMFLLFGVNIAICLASKLYHYDKHIWDVPPSDARSTRKIILTIEVLYVNAFGLTKLSVLSLYRRLSGGLVTPAIRHLSQASLIFVALYILAFNITSFLNCIPLTAFWDQVDPLWIAIHRNGDWRCVDPFSFMVSNGAIGTAQDFLACTIPLLLVKSLTLNKSAKFWLAAVFAVGYAVCIISIVRVISVVPIYKSTYDVTWQAHRTLILTSLEPNLAIICASLPCLRIYLKGIRKPSFMKKTQPTLPSFVRTMPFVEGPPVSRPNKSFNSRKDSKTLNGTEEMELAHMYAFRKWDSRADSPLVRYDLDNESDRTMYHHSRTGVRLS